jgi:thiamine biosynthesis protein ThiS
VKITVNQKQREWEENQPLTQLLQEKKVTRAAVWVNGRQLLNQEIPEYLPQEGDEIRILRLVGGG